MPEAITLVQLRIPSAAWGPTDQKVQAMRHGAQQLLILFRLAIFITLIAGESPNPVLPIDHYPGPIPLIDPDSPYGWPNEEIVWFKRSYFINVKPDKSALKKCLIRCNTDRFYDSWLDDVCQ